VNPPYPTAIPPLLPEFLQRRRSKMTFPLEKTEELGIDRATFIWVINLSYRGDRGASGEPGDLMSVYATIPERWLPMAAAARGAGLVEERGGRWYLTNKGRQLARAMHDAARSHYASLSPLSKSELAELARLLDRAFRAGADAAEPRVRLHTPFAFGYRGEEPPDGSFAQLDAAVYGLWQVRDDSHVAAWQEAGLKGPEVELLTRVWRDEATDEEGLAALLPHQRAEDIHAGLVRLRERGLVEPSALRTTPAGRATRQRIEDETDRLFFSPWPAEVGAKAPFIAESLAKVNAALN
jgi:hypothetical protein